MKKILLAAILVSISSYSLCIENRSFLLWKNPADGAWKVHLYSAYADGKNTYFGFDNSGDELLKDLENKDINLKPNPLNYPNSNKNWKAYFYTVRLTGKTEQAWSPFFYDLKDIQLKKFPVAPHIMEPLTYQILTSSDVVQFIANAPEAASETVTSAGPKLSGIKLVKFSGKPDCIGMKIEYKWPEPGTVNTIHFYDHNTDYYCFSNTFLDAAQDPKLTGPKKFSTTIDGVAWRATEYYFQAQKFQTPADAYAEMTKKQIGPGSLPGVVSGKSKQTKLTSARKYQNTDPEWFKISDTVMLKAIRAKFSQHPELREVLLSTYPKMVIEDTKQASYTEIIWGAGKNYTGCNLLGQILMHVRQELHDGQFYVFKKGDAKYYYDLLSGQTNWTQDNSPHQNWIPDGYKDLMETIRKTEEQKKPPVKRTTPPTQTGTPPDLMRLTELLKQLAE